MIAVSLLSLVRLASSPAVGVASHGFAYLDPGSGSYLLQLLIAGALGFAFAIKMFWGQIRGFFLRLFGKGESADTDKNPS